jgi:hypothetical protein
LGGDTAMELQGEMSSKAADFLKNRRALGEEICPNYSALLEEVHR